MEKRKKALWFLFLSVLFILMSIESVTGAGVLEGKCSCFQTISPFGKYFTWTIEELTVADKLSFSGFFRILFIIGLLLLYVPNSLLFHESKVRGITLFVVNTVGMLTVLLLFLSCDYMMMLITVNVMLFMNVLLQYIRNYRGKYERFTLVSSALVVMLNIFFLFLHLMKRIEFYRLMDRGAGTKLTEELISISRVNMICFVLWGIPLITLMLQYHKESKRISLKE